MGNLVVQHANNDRTLGIGLKLINDGWILMGPLFLRLREMIMPL